MNGCVYRTTDGKCEFYSDYGKGIVSWCDFNDCEDKKPSNADRIRSMTDEELATVIALPYLASPPWCANHTTCPYISEDPTPCDKCALEWLKQEASDG